MKSILQPLYSMPYCPKCSPPLPKKNIVTNPLIPRYHIANRQRQNTGLHGANNRWAQKERVGGRIEANKIAETSRADNNIE